KCAQALSRIPLGYALLENVQCLDDTPGLRRCSCSINREIAVIAGRSRGHPFALVTCKVSKRHRSTERVGLGYYGPGNLSLVEDITTVLLDEPKRVRQCRVRKNCAGHRGNPLDIKGIDRIRIQLRTASPERQGIGQDPTAGDFLG